MFECEPTSTGVGLILNLLGFFSCGYENVVPMPASPRTYNGYMCICMYMYIYMCVYIYIYNVFIYVSVSTPAGLWYPQVACMGSILYPSRVMGTSAGL
jgi:hypothetical protein